MASVARPGGVEREMRLETKEPEGELLVDGPPQTLHEIEIAPLRGSGPRGIEPPHAVLSHLGKDPMAVASADTRPPKLAVAEGGLRFTRPELDFAAIEKPTLNRPAVLRDPRGERL